MNLESFISLGFEIQEINCIHFPGKHATKLKLVQYIAMGNNSS